MAERKKKPKAKRGKKTTPPKKSHPRKIPLILQTRMVKDDEGQEEVTVGDLVIRAIRIGAYRTEAAEAAGVSKQTLHNWMNRGEDAIAVAVEKAEDPELVSASDVPEGERPYVDFVDGVKRATASAEVFHLSNIRQHAVKNWTASAWWLERTRPERYGRRDRDGRSDGMPSLADLYGLVDAAKSSGEG